jgi:hypothetical protein
MKIMSVTINKNITDKIAEKTKEDKMMEKFLLEILQIEAEHKQFKKNYLPKIEKYAREYKGEL